MAKNNKQGLPYVPAVVKKKLEPLTYLVQTQDGLTWRRNIDHLKSLGHDATVPEPADEEIIFPTWLDTSSPSVPDTVQPQTLNNNLLDVIHNRGGSRVWKEGGHLSKKQLKTKKTC